MGISSEQLEAMLKDPIAASDELAKLTEGDGNPSDDNTGDSTAAATPTADAATEKKEPTAEGKTPEAKQTEGKPAEEAAKTDEGVDPTKAVVMTKDGRPAIPYAVLASERERVATLERQLQEANNKLANLDNAVKTGKPDETPELARLSDEEMADLESTSPTLAKVFKGLYAHIDQQQEQLRAVQQEAAARVRTVIDTSIDAVPKLAFVKAQNPAVYNEIAEIDKMLRAKPRWAGRPLSDRFAAAVKLYEAENGEIQMPGAASDRGEPTKDPAAAAKEAIDRASETAHPNTLTDIPGGKPPPKDELETIGEKSAASLTNMFLGMDNKDITEFLSRFS